MMAVSCKFAGGERNGTVCCANADARIEHGTKVSTAICMRVCKYYEGPNRGAGDLVKKVVGAVSLGMVKPCAKCGDKQIDWNHRFPSAIARKAV